MTVTPAQRQQAKQTRFNPLRSITPAALTTALDSFETGYLRSAALIWETIERRVPVIANAVGKRKRTVSRRPWEVLMVNDDDQSAGAKEQKAFIDYFFRNLTARDALRGNMRGGMSLLIKQMMDGPFKRNAVHELVFKPTKNKQLTVECTFVPLWFFEETTGALRYTGPLYSAAGSDLKDGEWMVTAGDGVMEAISVAYMFWKLSLEDWVNFSERFGTPGVLGRTRAAKGSPEGDAMAAAVAAFGTDFEGVIYGDDGTLKDALTLIESSRTGDQPFEPMVERMERTIVALCRGADLGTLSSKDGAGASLQEDEGNILEEDDCELISETLNQHLVKTALEWRYGRGVEQLVKVQITPSATTDVAQERQTDEFLIKHGVRITKNDLAERYGRTQAEGESDEEIAAAQQPQDAETGGRGDGEKNSKSQISKSESENDADLEAQLAAAFLEGFNGAANDADFEAKHPRGAHGMFGEGTAEHSRDSARKSARSKLHYNGMTAEKMRVAFKYEAAVAKAIDGHNLPDNEPFDVLTDEHCVEVKTLIDGKADKITMRKECLARKVKFARKNKKKLVTIAIDARTKPPAYYVRKGIGSFRLTGMDRVASLSRLKEAIA